ncbi:hypothetical protein [Paenibacillus sp. PL91]|uniref:hypothetical protein n=1 Tax=Paenibacillus sp. PL91 TaxID=2729538 RepID=UPI00145D86A4|nr:hypothetical protein [Paenibacillus sp. PL91]MBC9199790.1 hypothetical protein [Paenibacillus sp. PL91]
MSDEPHNKEERNTAFKEFIEDNKNAVRSHSDSQPKSIKPDDEWAEEHGWTEMHEGLQSKLKKDD